MNSLLAGLRIKIFADGADKAGILSLNANPLIKGMTTNPTLMRKAGIADYEAFARDVLETVTTKPISFEVFSDEFPEMRRQAMKIAGWQKNVFVKIPSTNTRSESCVALAKELAAEGVQLNITAILTLGQIRGFVDALNPQIPSVLSVFAGRIADTGTDPVPAMQESLRMIRARLPKGELLWASVREVLNIYQADEIGCHIITVTPDLIKKLALKDKDLDAKAYSLATAEAIAYATWLKRWKVALFPKKVDDAQQPEMRKE